MSETWYELIRREREHPEPEPKPERAAGYNMPRILTLTPEGERVLDAWIAAGRPGSAETER